MRFYGIDYLQTQSNINDYLKYIIIFSALFILIVVFSLYMRHRLQTKEGANKWGNSSRLTQSFHFFMFEPIFSPVNALNQPI